MVEGACRKSGVKARRCLLAGAMLLVSLCMLAPGAGHALYPTAVAQAQSQGDGQTQLPTFVDLPQDAQETYPGSKLYKAAISTDLAADVSVQSANNYRQYGIAPESNLGLPLVSVYLTTADGKHVELAVYERAAFTIFNGYPARQILSTITSEGKVQIATDQFVQLPDAAVQAFGQLTLAGEGDPSTSKVAQMAELLTSNADANWTEANQMLNADGELTGFDIKAQFPNLTPDQLAQYTLGKADPQTGHKTPDIITKGLTKMFGDQVIENAGLPKGPAVWIEAKIGGKVEPVLFQQYERMAITVNPNNADAPLPLTVDMKEVKNKNVVQAGLQGQIVYNGLLAVNTAPTPPPTEAANTPTPVKSEASPTAATGKSFEVQTKYGNLTFVDNNSMLDLQDSNSAQVAQFFERIHEQIGQTDNSDITIQLMENGDDLKNQQGNDPNAGIKDYNLTGPNNKNVEWFVTKNQVM